MTDLTTIQDIAVGLIYRSINARDTNDSKVAEIAASIKDVGLLNPISVRTCDQDQEFRIIAGHHRFEAICSLKWPTVPCIVLDLDDLRAELAEIDENLMRSDLSTSEMSIATFRRKVVYEKLHPETKAAGNIGPERQFVAAGRASFASATAAATGKDKRTIERAAARGKALGDDLKAVKDTSLDSGVELDALAKLSVEVRRELIAKAKAGEKVSARSEDAKTLRDVRDGRQKLSSEISEREEAAEDAAGIIMTLRPAQIKLVIPLIETCGTVALVAALNRLVSKPKALAA
jgi:ParB family chromosome partitioning protein